jgi:2-oxoglutarate dehydrogenase E2 component (dihydrolipoamide succinyltransferase)
MTLRVTLPQLGESVDSGTIVAWLVAVGDTVTLEQPIVEISTDKVDTEIPTPAAGTVVALLAEVGQEVAVGAPILEIETGDDTDTRDDGATSSTPDTAAAPEQAPQAPVAEPRTTGATPPGPPARTSSTEGMRLSPLVKSLLRSLAIDPSTVVGTGPGGRITADDVRAAAGGTQEPRASERETSGAPAAAPRAVTPVRTPGSRVEPLTRTRKVIAERMLQSLQTTAQLTSAVEADVTRIMSIRARIREQTLQRHGVSLSPLAFIAHATARALADHPVLNASIDTEAGEVVYHSGVGLGIAVDAPQGLIVPVLRDAHQLSVVELQQRIADVAARARDKRLTLDDLQGGTFTITNTGSRGSLFDTPILNPPEVGILATPAIEKRPVIMSDEDGGDRIAIRHRTYLCLTYDHRLVDGADAARFLGDLAGRLDSNRWGPEIDEILRASGA